MSELPVLKTGSDLLPPLQPEDNTVSSFGEFTQNIQPAFDDLSSSALPPLVPETIPEPAPLIPSEKRSEPKTMEALNAAILNGMNRNGLRTLS